MESAGAAAPDADNNDMSAETAHRLRGQQPIGGANALGALSDARRAPAIYHVADIEDLEGEWNGDRVHHAACPAPGFVRVVLIVGPPAVGKMAVGLALAERTGWSLLHNHLVPDMVSSVVGPESDIHRRLVVDITRLLLDGARAGNVDTLIVTQAYSPDDPWDTAYIDLVMSFADRVQVVELDAPLEVRLERNRTELRLSHKPSKRDLERSEGRVRAAMARRFGTPAGVPPHVRLDNSELSAADAARLIEAQL